MDLLGPDFSTAIYWTEFDERGERLVMPIRREWKTIGLALLGFGASLYHTIPQLRASNSIWHWLSTVTIAVISAALVINILTSLLAREEVQIAGGELRHSWRLLGLRRGKSYPLAGIRGLGVHRDEDTEAKPDQLVSPLRDFGKRGAVVFHHSNGQKAALGVALDDDHAEQVVNWILRRAPAGING